MELGQWLLQGSDVQEFEAYWASDGIDLIANKLADISREYDGIGANTNSFFENDTFMMKDYCWCDNEREGHEEACPPNFVHKPTNFIITWYKYYGRGMTANKNLSALEWLEILKDCIQSLEEK